MRRTRSSFGLCLLLGLGACGKAKVAGQAAGDGGPPAEEDGSTVDLSTAVSDGAMPVSTEGCPTPPATRPAGMPAWNTVSGLKSPQGWYASPAAAYVAENILYYQNVTGGWPKDIDMTYRFGVDETGARKIAKSMIDNSATTTQIRFMAHMLGSWPTCQRFSGSFEGGMRFLFDAQYTTNGGWPQVWPIEPTDYSRRITYNDNAMVHVLQILRDIVHEVPLFAFVSAETKEKAGTALVQGVDCILKTQIVVDGKRTGWCAQHDEVTLLPAEARAYELPSESGKEGAQVLAFLLTLDLARADLPRQGVIEAVEAAVQFYDSLKITGLRYVQGTSDAGAADSWVVAEPRAGPLWARFYDLEPPFKPFFSDRDGIKVYSLAEVGQERRGGYTWYVTDPLSILSTAYPTWVNKWAIGRNVLGSPSNTDAGLADGLDAAGGSD